MRQFSTVMRHMIETSAEIPALISGSDVDRASMRLVGNVIDADEVLWTHLDLSAGSATVRSGPDLAELSDLGVDLARTADAHPVVTSYLQPGDDRRPRRVSDVTGMRSWTTSPAYGEAFRSRGGRFQLSLVTRLTGVTGTGWVLTRSFSDFTSSDVEAAALLLPFLTVLTALARIGPASSSKAREPLTTRESAVLALLAQGLPATTIGHRLGIAEGTVRKHLNHVYAKFGVHDRMGAVLAGVGEDTRPFG